MWSNTFATIEKPIFTTKARRHGEKEKHLPLIAQMNAEE
jgi:hypothetical protein